MRRRHEHGRLKQSQFAWSGEDTEIRYFCGGGEQQPLEFRNHRIANRTHRIDHYLTETLDANSRDHHYAASQTLSAAAQTRHVEYQLTSLKPTSPASRPANVIVSHSMATLLKFRDPARNRQRRATAQTLACIRQRGEMEPFPGGRV